jgi:hypothetical protein
LQTGRDIDKSDYDLLLLFETSQEHIIFSAIKKLIRQGEDDAETAIAEAKGERSIGFM